MTEYISNDKVYLIACISARFLQGIGNALVQTATYAIITYVYSENREKYLGQAEAVTGIGLMLGPVIGGPLYVSLGYFGSFMVFAGIVLVSMLIAIFITPGVLNNKVGEDGEEGEEVPILTNSGKQVSFKMFLTNKRAMIALVSVTVVCFFMSYQAAFLTNVLKDNFDMDES